MGEKYKAVTMKPVKRENMILFCRRKRKIRKKRVACPRAQANISLVTRLLPLLSTQENSVISPHGIAAVLAMAAEGASEESLLEIVSALGFTDMDELRKSVLHAKKEPYNAFTSENTIILKHGYNQMELLDEFEKTMAERYQATVEEEDSDGMSGLRLRNIAKFKGQWKYKPEKSGGYYQTFTNADGTSSMPDFLCVEERFRYYRHYGEQENDYVKAVALPYEVGGVSIPYEMILLECSQILSEEDWKHILSNMKYEECNVTFPEFTIETDSDMIPLMEEIGLKSIFSSERGAFDHMATEPLFAERFWQKAKIEVNEEGTVAEAFTDMDDCCLGGSLAEGWLRFDRPFAYFVRNTETGEIVFMGKVNHFENGRPKKRRFIKKRSFIKEYTGDEKESDLDLDIDIAQDLEELTKELDEFLDIVEWDKDE